MDTIEVILNAVNDKEVDKIIENKITSMDKNSTKVGQLGFLSYGKANYLFSGFIPLKTRIKYENLAVETYGMETTDYFYEFAHFLRKYNINSKGSLIYNLEYFINNYFGYPNGTDRSEIFNEIAWQTTATDEDYFAALENNKIGDLKGKGVAQCTERSALAQQILSLFGTEIYYCMGCIDLGDRQEGHCFNIVKRKSDYALLDYSVPVTVYNQDGSIKSFYPFVGEMSNAEFNEFVTKGIVKSFDNYEYVNNQKKFLESKRSYIVGSFEFEKENVEGKKRT